MKIIIFLLLLFAVQVFSQDEFSLAKIDTVNAQSDTLSRQLIRTTSNSMNDTCNKYQVMWTANDTIQISSQASYPSNNTFILLPTVSILDWEWFSPFVANWYWKVYGTGTATVYTKVKGWSQQ